MADKEKNVVLNFKMDGQVQYAETIREINAVMNTAAKEYKNHIAAMGKDADMTDKLAAEKKKLEIQMEAAQKRTKMLSDQYEAMSKDTKTTTGQLTQMYGKLLDAEKAETALQKSLDRVNDGLSDQAQEARKAQSELDELKQENKLLEAEQKNLTSAFKLQKAELGDNASEAEKLELAQKQLSQQMHLSERTIKNLESQLEQAKKVYGENSVEVMQFEAKLNDARTTISKFNSSLDGIESASDNAGDGLNELGKKMDLNNIMEATEILQGLSDKLIELGQLAFDSAMQVGDSQTNLQANLGLTEEAAEQLNEVVDQVFRNGVVESLEEATNAVVIVRQTFEDLNGVDLEKLTNKVTTIAKRTDTDVSENIRAAEQLMIAFGLSGEKALDIIAAGYQNGLNRSDDFIDTLIEYAPHFETAGYSAEQMLQVLNNGLENGARNTDLAADAVKEFQIRLGDGSIEKVMENYSKETQKVFEEWQNGKATVADVANAISKELNKMEPHEQQAAISELSTQFEDLGREGATALFSVGEGFDNVNGKADEMAQKSPGEKWESSMRELQLALLPLGEALTNVAMNILPPIVEGLENFTNWFKELPGPMQTFVTVFGAVVGIATIAIPVILGVAAAITALQVPLLPIIAIVLAIAAAIAGLVLVIQNWGSITDWLGEKWEQFSEWIQETLGKVVEFFNTALDWIDEKTNGKFKSVTDTIRNFLKMAQDIVGNAIEFFKNTFKNGLDFLKAIVTGDFQGMKDAISNQMGNIKNTISNIWGNVMDFFKGIDLWDTGKKIIGGFIKGFKSLKIPIPHFSVKGKLDLNPVGGISLPKIDIDWRAKGGIFTQPTIFGASNGRLQGAGEAGPEAVLPLNAQTLGDIGRGIAAEMGESDRNITVHVYLDTDQIGESVNNYNAVDALTKVL